MINIHMYAYYIYIYIILIHTLKYTPMSLQLMRHINLLMDENNCKIDPTIR